MNNYKSLIFLAAVTSVTATAQVHDSGIIHLKEISVKGYKSITGMGHLKEVNEEVIYSGQKNEVLIMDSLDANTAQDNPRQVLGRVPGSNYSETEGSGFPANGIGFRGLNPTQSVESNTRQNGYNIAGDIYGYPESYYMTPLEALDRVELIRGASSLQFGPQFGGVINYIIKSAPTDKAFEFNTEETAGSYGLLNTFNSAGGTKGKWNYYGFLKAEYASGQRPNSKMKQASAFARVEYKPNEKFRIGLEYSIMRNMLHMPGGLDDAEFKSDPFKSYRSRNWLVTPWNIVALTSTYKISDKTSISIKSALNISSRSIVWKNEDGGPEAIDSFSTSSNAYQSREVESEYFRNSTTEVRLLTHYNLSGREQTLAAGVRVFYGKMGRLEGGLGSTGSDADFKNYEPNNQYDNNLTFHTTNVAPFVENTFHIGDKLSITPGFRFEYLNSDVQGKVLDSTGTYYIDINNSKPRYIPLAGIALQFKTSENTDIYGNITQAYTPISYSFLYPMGLDIDAKIDPNLKDISGYNADLGWRGNVHNYFTFDVSAFFMAHNNNIAIETLPASGNGIEYFETNIGNAIHKGVEAYAELNLVKLFTHDYHYGTLSIFNSFAWDHATYESGIYKSNQVEYAPAFIDRMGLTYSLKRFSTTFLYSHTAKSFADATNTVYSDDAEVGVIPAYSVMDWSATYRFSRYNIKAGINNLTDAHYFTFRTVEYPGPGIIPSMGRSWYVGFGMKI